MPAWSGRPERYGTELPTPPGTINVACIAAPTDAKREEEFTGPRFVWGARIARAVHAAVRTGAVGYAATISGRTQ